MQIVKIAPLDNGAHENQTIEGTIPLPDGWAVIPEGMEIPESFPFVGVEAQDGVVTRLTPGVVPEPEPEPEPEEQITADDLFAVLLGMEDNSNGGGGG